MVRFGESDVFPWLEPGAVIAPSGINVRSYRITKIGRHMIIWVTGLSGAGKTTLCNAIVDMLKPTVPESVMLDGDIIRDTFGNDLGYREEDRNTQIRRMQNLARMLEAQSLVVVVAALYAHPDLLHWNRENMIEYNEIYLQASLDTLRARDPKGLYAKSAGNANPQVVGLDIPWHEPVSPNIVFDSDEPAAPEEWAREVVASIPSIAKRVPVL